MPNACSDRAARAATARVSSHQPSVSVAQTTMTDGWWLDTLAVAALAARSLHALGMLTSKTLAAHGPLRDAGAMGTYLTGVLLGVTALVAL